MNSLKQRRRVVSNSFFYIITYFIAFVPTFCLAKPFKINFEVKNQVKQKCDLFWIGFDGELVPQLEKPLFQGDSHGISSYKSHKFVLCWYGHQDVDSNSCKTFVVGDYDFTVIITGDENSGIIEFEIVDAVTTSRQYLSEALTVCSSEDVGCIAGQVAEQIFQNKTKALLELIDRKDHVTESLRQYSCNDTSLDTSEPIETKMWSHEGKSYQFDILLDEPAAKIGVLHDFITPEQCQLLRERGEGDLRLATVATSDGDSEISSARKALANMVNPNLNDLEDPLTKLYHQGYAFVNSVKGYNLPLHGQEGFSLVKYEPGMEYTPHCDGNCAGQPHKPGGRVATIVFYCQEAEVGGATTFTNANVHVRGKAGQASFFSYMDENAIMDTKLTHHSGCPILKGEKWIATLWMRQGLTDHCTWHQYDPEGQPLVKRCVT